MSKVDLDWNQTQELRSDIEGYPEVFANKPGSNTQQVHDIAVTDATRIKKMPIYHTNPRIKEVIRKERKRRVNQTKHKRVFVSAHYSRGRGKRTAHMHKIPKVK